MPVSSTQIKQSMVRSKSISLYVQVSAWEDTTPENTEKSWRNDRKNREIITMLKMKNAPNTLRNDFFSKILGTNMLIKNTVAAPSQTKKGI